jgi:hypothetical protein
MVGSPQSWHQRDWETVGILGLLFGVVLGIYFYRKPVRAIRADDLNSELRTVSPPSAREPKP